MPDIPIESILLGPVLPDFPAEAITRSEPHAAEQDYQEGEKSLQPAFHAYPPEKEKATTPEGVAASMSSQRQGYEETIAHRFYFVKVLP